MAAGPGAIAAGLAAAAAGFFGSIAGPGAIAAILAAAAAAGFLGSMTAGLAGMGAAAAARQRCPHQTLACLWDKVCFARDCTKAHIRPLVHHIILPATHTSVTARTLVTCLQSLS